MCTGRGTAMECSFCNHVYHNTMECIGQLGADNIASAASIAHGAHWACPGCWKETRTAARRALAPRDSAEGEKAAQGPQADQRRHWQQAEVTGGRQQGGGQGSANIFDRTSPFLALQTPSALGLRPGKRRRRANASTAPLSPLPPFSPRGGGVGGANSACPIPTA
jgi:hypothetical protein